MILNESGLSVYIDGAQEAQEAIQHLEKLLEEGEDVVLICYENTDEKQCHRTLLQDRIATAAH